MIRILYNYAPDGHGLFSYQPIVCLTDRGPIPSEILLRVYRKQWPHRPHHQGEFCFQSLGDLQQFSFLLLQELGLKYCYLLSRESYNEGVQQVSDGEQFQEIFTKYGDVITNHESESKKRFFEKFFQ